MRRAWPLILTGLTLYLLAWWQTRLEQPSVTDEAGIHPTPSSPTLAEPVQSSPQPSTGTGAETPVIVVSEETPARAETGIDLRGWIGDTDGSAVGGIEIETESRGFDGEDINNQRTQSNDNGEFVLRGIVPGRQYKLEVRPQADFAAFSLDSFSTENRTTLEHIVLQRIDLVDVDGMIVDTGFAPVPDFELLVRSLSAEYPDRVIRSDSSGYFRLSAFPAGELRIATSASDYYRIKGIELRPDEYRNLTLMIDRGNYHLSGWVGDENGVPLADVQITLKSAFATDEYHSFSYRTAVTDANGGFEFAGLGGHRLTLGIYARGFESLIRQHEFESFADRLELRLQRQRPQQGGTDTSE